MLAGYGWHVTQLPAEHDHKELLLPNTYECHPQPYTAPHACTWAWLAAASGCVLAKKESCKCMQH